MLTITITLPKIQVRGLCVGGDMAILPWNEPKTNHISVYTQPTRLIFGTVIVIVSIFYHDKNQVGGLCVGGGTIQPGTYHTPQKLYKTKIKKAQTL